MGGDCLPAGGSRTLRNCVHRYSVLEEMGSIAQISYLLVALVSYLLLFMEHCEALDVLPPNLRMDATRPWSSCADRIDPWRGTEPRESRPAVAPYSPPQLRCRASVT